MSKICPMCKIRKSDKEFFVDWSRKDGLERVCKICSNWLIQKDMPVKSKKLSGYSISKFKKTKF